jgi:hypothetical protein
MVATIIAALFASAFATNSVPHLVKGMTGQRHQTPRRHGDTAVANAVWGWANVVAAVFLWRLASVDHHEVAALSTASVGSLVVAAALAHTWSRHPERNESSAGQAESDSEMPDE